MSIPTNNEQKPTIGRIVFYWVLNSEECQDTPNPAIVTRANPDGTVDLHIFGDLPPDSNALRRKVSQTHNGACGSWSWPTRS